MVALTFEARAWVGPSRVDAQGRVVVAAGVRRRRRVWHFRLATVADVARSRTSPSTVAGGSRVRGNVYDTEYVDREAARIRRSPG
jgi:hypothetical protein